MRTDALRRPTFVIVAATLIVHGALILNDGVYWDDWLWVEYMRDGRWDLLSSAFSQMGTLPATAHFFWLFRFFPGIVPGFKIAVFGCTVASALLVHALAVRSGRLTAFECLMMSVLFVTYPGLQTQVLLSTSHYALFYTLFLGAAVVSLAADEATGAAHVVFRVAATALFFVSFSLNSLLVYYFGFLIFFLDHRRRRHRGQPGKLILRFALHRIELALLPFAFWLVKESLFPRHGLYADYNRFRPGLSVVSSFFFLRNALLGQIDASLTHLLANPALWFAALVAVYRVRERFKPVVAIGADSSGSSVRSLIGFGGILLGLGVLPYVAVGRYPSLHGSDTRHAYLVGLPLSLLLVAGARALDASGPADAGRGASRLGVAVLVSLALGFSLATLGTYAGWQARWVKDRSIMTHLARMPGAERYSRYRVDDLFPLGGERGYAFYEWSTMFKRLWGGQSRMGIDVTSDIEKTRPYLRAEYHLADYDPHGPQARLTIRRGPLQFGDADLSLRYEFFRLLARAKLDDFLLQVADVTVEPTAPGAATAP